MAKENMLTLKEMLGLATRVPEWAPDSEPRYSFRRGVYNNHDGNKWTSINDASDELRYITLDIGLIRGNPNLPDGVHFIYCSTAYVSANSDIDLGNYTEATPGEAPELVALLEKVRSQYPEKLCGSNWTNEARAKAKGERLENIKANELMRLRKFLS